MVRCSELSWIARHGMRLGAPLRYASAYRPSPRVTRESVRAQVRIVGGGNVLASFKLAASRKDEERDLLVLHYAEAVHELHGARAALTFINDVMRDGTMKSASNVFAQFFQFAAENGEGNRVVNDARKLMNTFKVSANAKCSMQMVRALASANEIDVALPILLDSKNAEIWTNVDVWNSVLTAVASHGSVHDIDLVLTKMREYRVPSNPAMYNSFIRVCCERGDMEKARRVLNSMRGDGFRPSLVTYNTMLSGYSKLQDMNGVDRTFEDMRCSMIQPDTMTYNAILSARISNSSFDEVNTLFARMHTLKIEPDETTLKFAVHALFALERASAVPEVVNQTRRKFALGLDTELVSELVKGYVKSNMAEHAWQTVSAANVEQVAVPPKILAMLAHKFAVERKVRDAANVMALIGSDYRGVIGEETLELVIQGYLNEGNLSKAQKYVQMSDELGFRSTGLLSLSLMLCHLTSDVPKLKKVMDSLSAQRPLTTKELCLILTSFSRAKDGNTSLIVFKALSESIITDRNADSELDSALNDFLLLQLEMQNRENLAAALKLAKRTNVALSRDVQIGLIRDKLALGDSEAARAMLSKLNYADSEICHDVLEVFANDGNVDACFSVVKNLSRMGLNWGEETYALLITAHGKANQITKAEETFESLLRKEAKRILPGSKTHNALLVAYAWTNRERDAMLQMDRMRRYNLTVDADSYEALVQMYLSRKQIGRATRLLYYMRRTGVWPTSETVRAILGVYCQANNLEDARRAESHLCDLGLASDVQSYNDILEVYSSHGRPAEIYSAFQQIRSSGARPNVSNYLQFIHACEISGESLLLANAVKEMPMGAETRAAIVRAFAACGEYQRAVSVLDTSKQKILADEATLNAQLVVYSKMQRLSAALSVCQQITEGNFNIDERAYDALTHLIRKRRGESVLEVSETLRKAGVDTSSSSFVKLVNNRKRLSSRTADLPAAGQRHALPTNRQPSQPEQVTTSVESQLSSAAQRGDHELVVKRFKALQKGGPPQLRKTVYQSVLSSILLAGTATEAEMAVEEATERSLHISSSACERVIEKFARAEMVPALEKVLALMQEQKMVIDQQHLVTLFQLQVKNLQLLGAQSSLKQIHLSENVNSAKINEFHRLLMQKQIESADPAGAIATLDMLTKRWNIEVEDATISLAVKSCGRLGVFRALLPVLQSLRGCDRKELSKRYCSLLCAVADAGNVRAVDGLIAEMRRLKLHINASAEKSVREALTRSGELRAATRWKRTADS